MVGVGNPQQTDDRQRMNDDTLLYRQVHPNFIARGNVTRQAFLPTSKDERLLSVYNGDEITPKQSRLHYVNDLKLESAGVVGVSVAQCNGLQLPVRPDPAPFPEHAVIDFAGLSRNQIKEKAVHLKTAANARGWLFRA